MYAVYYTLVTVYCADVCDEDTKETYFKMENNIVYGVSVERPGIQLNSAWVWALILSLHQLTDFEMTKNEAYTCFVRVTRES